MKKPFTGIAIGIFSLIALAHLLRLISGWEVTVNGLSVPIWVSGIAFVVVGGLAAMVWLEARR